MIKPILRFTKIEHTAFSLPLLFTGAWLGAGQAWPPVGIVVLIVLAATGARVYGMGAEPHYRSSHRCTEPAEPHNVSCPAAVMNLKTAGAITLTGLVAYLSALCHPGALVPGIVAVTAGYRSPGYSFLKRFTVLCHFGIGLCLAMELFGSLCGYRRSPLLFTGGRGFFLVCFFSGSAAPTLFMRSWISSMTAKMVSSAYRPCLGADRAQAVSAGLHFAALMCLGADADAHSGRIGGCFCAHCNRFFS